MTGFGRRQLLLGAAAGSLAAPPSAAAMGKGEAALSSLQRIESEAHPGKRRWLGPDWWANRLQDWQRADDWIECTTGAATMEVRTAGLLSLALAGTGDGVLETKIAAATEAGRGGFGGWLLGVGKGALHPLAAALAQRGSGRGGGILAVVDADGRPHFREHTNEAAPLAFAELQASKIPGTAAADLSEQPLVLRLRVEDIGGRCRLTLSTHRAGGEELARAELAGVPSDVLTGALALVSSPPTGASGARFRFADVQAGGSRMLWHQDRRLGPCLATLHSVANGVLKLTAHFGVMGPDDSTETRLQIDRGSGWRTAATAAIGAGSCAIFRVADWNIPRPVRYRVLYAPRGKPVAVYQGHIRPDPEEHGKPMSVALLGCVLSTQHALEDNVITRVVPQERPFGRYQPENFNFPHAEIAANTQAHDPDFVFVAGDQYYEQNPTRVARDTPEADLDTLYRWQQWLVSFRDVVRDRPCVILVDDHDVLQGNLWGNGGRIAPERDQNQGGYVWGIPLAQMVYRMQCGHNPEAIEPQAIENGLPVSYSAFDYGGTSFAIVEDRKWKTSAVQGEDMNVHRAELLGSRQEAFLEKWKDMHPGKPKVLLSQSSWVCLQTDPEGRELTDFDSNGYPPLARYRATALAKAAGCVMLANDQHLPSLIRMGVDSHVDGPVQFVGPAGGSFWQRWFQPAARLPNARAGMEDRTGDWTDAFGNKMRVLAVANPKIGFAEFRKHNTGRSQAINDRALKSEGYGILRVDTSARAFVFECWPWDKGPPDGDAAQYVGWPYRLSFDEV